MKRRGIRAALCTFSVIGLSVIAGTAAMADEDSKRITIPYMQEDAWDELAMTNDDEVKTGVNIRATADDEGEIIGYLYQGGAAWVIKKGKEWTEIYSGGLTGFVKNEYLLYGRDVIGLADHYGLEGVATTWDDVNIYGSEGGTDVLEVLDSGSYFPLVEDGGHWLTVQYNADSTAWVSSEDVARVLILETAVSKDDVYEGNAAMYASLSEETYTEPDYTEPTYTEPTYTQPDYSEPTYTQTEAPAPETEAPSTEAPSTEAPETEAPSTEAPVDDGSSDYEDSSSDDATDTSGGYYDADTDTYYDENGNVVSSNYDSAWEDVYTETAEATEAYEETEAPQTEAPAPETEAPSTEASSSGSDTTSLLAALIYCEAGNQSYEGMVAVGAVVMNRVYSSSFPNSVSEVIYQSGQFTPAYSGALDSALANGVPSTCYDAAVAALNGENPVGGALYFNTGSGKGTKIGDHQFY